MLADAIREKKSGILLYGLTPPKASHTHAEIEEIAQRQMARLENVSLDGLVLYDLQDEAQRTKETRPFPFLETIAPQAYATEYLHPLGLPFVVYRAIGKYPKEETATWLQAHNDPRALSVFVGAAAKDQPMSMSMQEAYGLRREVAPWLLLGGIAIPERHMKKHDEHERVVQKVEEGCSFFVTQAVYDLEASKRFLDDYVALSKKKIFPWCLSSSPLRRAGRKKPLHL